MEDLPILRPEAQALPISLLDEQQLEAVRVLGRCLADAVAEISKPASSQPVRNSRTFFVNGGRGAGKTTVIHTLRELVVGRPADTPIADNQLRLSIEKLRGQTIWLELLDLEAFPRDGNVFGAILARLGKALDRPIERRGRGLLDSETEEHDAVIRLHRFAHDVAVGWEGNLGARKASLDPNTFAAEAIRAEKARVDLPARFADVVRDLSQAAGNGTHPLFVLVVDDADLNAVACRDFLRVLRTILSPHLFVIALGDQHLFVDVLRLTLIADLRHVSGGEYMIRYSTDGPGDALSIESRADELFRKYFPRHQRAALGYLTPNELMRFVPPETATPLAPLGVMIAAVDSPVASEIVGRRLWSSELEPRAGAWSMQLRPRDAVDLWYELTSMPNNASLDRFATITGAASPQTIGFRIVEEHEIAGALTTSVADGKVSFRRLRLEVDVFDNDEFGIPVGHWPLGVANHAAEIELRLRDAVDFERLASSSPAVGNDLPNERICLPNFAVAAEVVSFWNSTLSRINTRKDIDSVSEALDSLVLLLLYVGSHWLSNPMNATPDQAQIHEFTRGIIKDGNDAHISSIGAALRAVLALAGRLGCSSTILGAVRELIAGVPPSSPNDA